MHGLIAREYVRTVGSSSLAKAAADIRASDGFVLAAANRPGALRPDWIAAPLSVLRAAQPSARATTVHNATAITGVQPQAVRGRPSLVGTAPTYDLEIDGLPEFFANGILVHNCSGLLTWAAQAAGLDPDLGDPNYTPAEGLKQYCDPVAWGDVQPGDLLLFDRTYDAAPGYATHCGASLGAGTQRMLDTHDGPGVGETDLSGAYWQSHLLSAWRPRAFVADVPAPEPEPEPDPAPPTDEDCAAKLAAEISYSNGLLGVMRTCKDELRAAQTVKGTKGWQRVASVERELTRNLGE